VNGGTIFGPPHWHSDALVCGYSRGKLHRTRLAKSEAGYVAQDHLLACLNMLTVDACVTPQGDLLVSVHSGGPDWGTGPTGNGKLYKLRYSDRQHPQPVLAWAAGPQEVHVAFDRELDPKQLANLAAQTTIEFGEHVRAGDRFESLQPGYAVVHYQNAAAREALPVHAAALAADGRTLILSTAPHTAAASYAITLPGLGRRDASATSAGELPQHAAIDLQYDLLGISAEWKPQGGGDSWSGWLPHPDLGVSRHFTERSAPHEQLWNLLRQPGTLKLRAQLDLHNMLRPAVQPGSSIDYTWPDERVTLVIASTAPLSAVSAAAIEHATSVVDGRQRVQLTFQPSPGTYLPLEVTLTSDRDPELSFAYFTAEDPRFRPLPLERFVMPWVEPQAGEAETIARPHHSELTGGSWARGRVIFTSEQALCSKCHKAHDPGGEIGPSLANLRHRDYASVLRDITQPSFAINPDYVAYAAVLESGQVLTGSLRTIGGKLHLGNNKGEVTIVDPDDVEELLPQKQSTMPEGILEKLNEQQLKDLLTYLLTPAPSMPDYGEHAPPPPRTRAEVDAVLAGAPAAESEPRPLQLVLVAGEQDHPRGEHDYPAWQQAWRELLAIDALTQVTTAWTWPSAEQFQTADVIVFYQRGDWTAERAADVDAFLARGGGLVYVHWAVDGRQHAPAFAQRIGLASGEGSKYRHGPLELGFESGPAHPISRNFDKVSFVDESYWNLTGDVSKVRVLATGSEEGQPVPLFWTLEPSRGRVFVSILGHFAWTFDDPLFRTLLLRGIAWTAREPVDRYNPLVTIGARMAE
jgi:putative heme-binding domain-containing protein